MITTKRIILLSLFIGTFTSIFAQQIDDSMTPIDSLATDSLPPLEATMQFDLMSYHLGTIYDHTKPTPYTFFYCNVGQGGLIIKRIETTCGCKVTQYPTDSLYYDQSGQIDIDVIPCKESGKFKKGIYVYANVGTFRLTISGKFMQPDYSYEDYSAIPTEEEEKALSGASTSSATGRDSSATDNASDVTKSKEKKKKKKERKKH